MNGGFTCEECRAKCDEAGTDPECDETGHPCILQEERLDPDNLLAWNLFWDRKHLGESVTGFYNLDLTEEEAGDLLLKLRVISEEVTRIQIEQQKEESERLRNGRGY